MNEYGNDIITVVDDEGTEHQFEELDRIETEEGKKYVALIPVFEKPEDMLDDSGELIILRVIEEEDENILEAIEDDDEFNDIGAIFQDRLKDYFDFEPDDDTEE